MDPHHLRADELEYELNLRQVRGASGTERNKARWVAERMREEEKDGTAFKKSPWELDMDLDTARGSVNNIQRVLAMGYDAERDYRVYFSRIRHLEARAARMVGQQRDVIHIMNLRTEIKKLRDELVPIVRDRQARPMHRSWIQDVEVGGPPPRRSLGNDAPRVSVESKEIPRNQGQLRHTPLRHSTAHSRRLRRKDPKTRTAREVATDCRPEEVTHRSSS